MSIATEGGHWYSRKGEPVYEVEAASGGLRPTTLRDARKLDLVPSVTTIMNCADKPALTKWKIEQHLRTAFECVVEQIDEFIQVVIAATRKRLDEAPDLGSAIHGAIERCLQGKEYTHQEHVAGALKAVREWCGSKTYNVEKSFAHPLGYGGKVDLHIPGFILDFKTKEFASDNLPSVWPNHSMQLAAYREGLGMPAARCAIIFVSTLEPGLTHTVEIPENELQRGWRMFRALLAYWQEDKKYRTENWLVEA